MASTWGLLTTYCTKWDDPPSMVAFWWGNYKNPLLDVQNPVKKKGSLRFKWLTGSSADVQFRQVFLLKGRLNDSILPEFLFSPKTHKNTNRPHGVA